MAHNSEITDALTTYIRENFLYARPDLPLTDEFSLLASGILDSMGVIEIVEFLQDRFDIQVRDEDIVEDNFGSLAAMTRYVQSRQRAA